MWSVATTTFNGILSGTSEKGREMHLLSVSGIVPSCPTIRYVRWRNHTQRKGNISGIQQPGSRLKREIRNDLPIFFEICLNFVCIYQNKCLPSCQQDEGTTPPLGSLTIKSLCIMKTYTAIYSTKAISNIQYSFKAESVDSAVEFCRGKFTSFPGIIIVENTAEGKANEGIVVWANGSIVL